MHEQGYLYVLMRYIERNPIKANITNAIGKYQWSSSSFLLLGTQEGLMRGSMLYDKDLFALLDVALSEEDMLKLETLQKTTYTKEQEGTRRQSKKHLKRIFLTLHL